MISLSSSSPLPNEMETRITSHTNYRIFADVLLHANTKTRREAKMLTLIELYVATFCGCTIHSNNIQQIYVDSFSDQMIEHLMHIVCPDDNDEKFTTKCINIKSMTNQTTNFINTFYCTFGVSRRLKPSINHLNFCFSQTDQTNTERLPLTSSRFRQNHALHSIALSILSTHKRLNLILIWARISLCSHFVPFDLIKK